ncbi:hypothetical protein BHM03_00046875 [Ensete ventricosum]|nr:hypothetical protein BHM03_00046875 [Ensete ventricosum]
MATTNPPARVAAGRGSSPHGAATRKGSSRPRRSRKGRLPPVGATTSAARATAPWQGGCRSQRPALPPA